VIIGLADRRIIMKNHHTIIAWSIAAVLLVAVVAGAAEVKKMVTKDFVMPMPDLKVADAPECDEAVNRVVDAYYAACGSALEQLRRQDVPVEGKVYAIYMLGELRSFHAVTELIANIDLKASKVDPRLRDARWGLYPAQEALVKIGRPATSTILDKLPSEAAPLRRKLMCDVILDVEGKDVARFLLDQEKGKQADPAKRANLEAAMKLLDG
jgi:hypothetical protein